MTALYFILATAIVTAAIASIRSSAFPAYGRGFVVLVLAYGLLVKPIFVALALPSADFIADFILAPLSISEYWTGSVLLLGCYALFVGAMILTSQALRHVRRPRRDLKPPPSIHFSIMRGWALLALGSIGMAIFFSQNPDLLFGANKNILASEDLAEYSASGGLRLLASVVYFVPFLMLANIRAGYRLHASRRLMWVAALAWITYGFLSDQRGALLFSVFSWFIAYRTLVGKIDSKQLLVASAVAVGMIVIRSVLRLVNNDGGPLAAASEIVGNYIGRNLIEHAKTLIIIDAIPQKLAYAYGGSYVDSILILIPRSLFAAKQTVNLDTIVGMSVFECNVFGACAVPPGLIAEAYLNFGFVGVPLMMLLCGWLTAWLDWKSGGGTLLFKLFYAASLVYFGLAVLGSSVSSFLTQAIMDGVVLLLAYHAARRSARTSDARGLASRTAS